MKTFMHYKDRRSADLDRHPFVQWLDANDIDVTQKLMFAPIMTNFVMNFRDMNLWVLRFDEQPNEHFRSIINDNTQEDETHSRLFLEDWDALDLDTHLGWSALDTLWWLFASPQTECFRRFGVEFIRLNVDDGGDPMLRFTHSEAGEACGHVFFRHVVGPTARLSEVTGKQYRYFGHYHLDRELGHVLGSEGEFETLVLDPDTRARGMALGERMFDIFFEIFDAFEGYARDHVNAGSVPRVPATIDPLPQRPHQPLPEALRSERPRPSSSIAARHLAKVLRKRKHAVATHPFYAWLREALGWGARQTLEFLLLRPGHGRAPREHRQVHHAGPTPPRSAPALLADARAGGQRRGVLHPHPRAGPGRRGAGRGPAGLPGRPP